MANSKEWTIRKRTSSFLAAGEEQKKSNDLGSFDGKQMYASALAQTRCQTIAPTACLLGNFRGQLAVSFSPLCSTYSSFYLSAPPPAPFFSPSRPWPIEEWGRKSPRRFRSWVMGNFLPQMVTREQGPQDLKLTLKVRGCTCLVALRPASSCKSQES